MYIEKINSWKLSDYFFKVSTEMRVLQDQRHLGTLRNIINKEFYWVSLGS